MNKICTKTLTCAAASLMAASSAFAASGTYTNATTGGLWSDVANWSSGAGPIADGAGFTADFSTLNITANNSVTLDGAANLVRTLGTLKFGDTTPSHSWTVTTVGGAKTISMDNTGGTGTASVDVSSGSVTFTSAAASALKFDVGTAGFNKTGAGTMIMESTNGTTWAGSGLVTVKGGSLVLKQFSGGSVTFTGDYQVDSGATLQLGASSGGGALFATSVVANSRTITLNGGTFRINRNGAFTLNQNVNGIAAGSLVNVSNNSSIGFTQDAGSVISGTTGFTMNTSGATATMNGANTFTGNTTVSAGNLAIAGSSNIATNAAGISIANVAGATLSLTGTLKALSTASGITLVGANSTLDLSSATDALDLSALTGVTNGQSYTFITKNGGTINGTFDTITGPSGFNASLDYGTGVLSFNAVPEPGAALLGGLGLMALLRRRRA